jgi:hypothetical protein
VAENPPNPIGAPARAIVVLSWLLRVTGGGGHLWSLDKANTRMTS